ncbi:MAG TPA: U32 family peptidase [Spirochaetota bacterium]
MTIKPEIVSPAGNPEKLRIAVRYGADAVYFGGEMLNLRENADNFLFNDLADGAAFCKENNVRSIFLLNSFLHENEIDDARAYINSIKSIPFDAVMVSDPGMISLVQESGIGSEIHLSTQMSTLNHLSISFWQKQGISRIVLARETTLDEIRMIRSHTDADIEVFVHGALCVAYSGRCLLSRYMSGRDANKGNCSQPCRWNYRLVEEKRPGEYFDVIEDAKGTEILSSKDLCLIEKLPEFVKAGVNAFKIEGRMKSIYYVANVTRIYKTAVQTILSGGDYSSSLPLWKEELDLVSHRPFTENLFNEFDGKFEPIPYVNKATYFGYVVSSEPNDPMSEIKVGNPFKPDDELEAIFPPSDGKIVHDKVRVLEIFENGVLTDMARPDRVLRVRFSSPLPAGAILRKRTSL